VFPAPGCADAGSVLSFGWTVHAPRMKKDCSAIVVLSISELIQSAEVFRRMTQFEGGQVSRH
jgi:hypothetical protein